MRIDERARSCDALCHLARRHHAPSPTRPHAKTTKSRPNPPNLPPIWKTGDTGKPVAF